MTFSFFILLWMSPSHRQAEVQKIDTEIQELQDMKLGYEARALRHENMAEYMQFEQKFVLETRRHIQLAEENRYKADLIQKQIDQLQEKRDRLTK